MKKYELASTTKFKKDLRKLMKRGYDIKEMDIVVETLLSGNALEPKYRDHALTGNWIHYRECHIEPDWLLIYRIENDILVLTLTDTGTHSDLF